jgi:hypothetical protein
MYFRRTTEIHVDERNCSKRVLAESLRKSRRSASVFVDRGYFEQIDSASRLEMLLV